MPVFQPGPDAELNDLVIARCKDAKLDISICAKWNTPILWNVYGYEFDGYDAIFGFLNEQDGSGQIYHNGINLIEENERDYQELLEKHERELKAKYPHLNLPKGEDPF